MRHRPSLTLAPIFTLLLVALLATATAATTPYYEGWVTPGQTFTVKGALYSVMQGSSPAQLLLKKGSDKYVLTYGDCVVSHDLLDEYCYDQSDYMDCQHHGYTCPEKAGEPDDWCCPYDVAHVSYEAGEAVWGAHLTFTARQPVIAVSHAATQNTLKLGESTDVTLTFENTGEDTVTNAAYRETIPDGFSIIPSSDFTRRGNTLSLRFSLAPGVKKTYAYTIRPTAYLSEPILGNLTYTYHSLSESVTPKELLISVPSPFFITHAFTPGSPKLGEKATYTYTLKNTDGQDEMTARLTFAGSLLAVADTPAGLTVENGLLVWEGTLEKGKDITFTFPFTVEKTGSLFIDANASMTFNNDHFTFPLQDRLTTTTTLLAPEIRFSGKARAGKNLTVTLFLKNGETPYTNIQGVLTPGTNIFSLARIAPDETALLGTLTITPEESETFTLKGSYQSLYGETFTFSTQKELAVDTSGKAFLITRTVNQTSAKPGETVEVSVSVKDQQGRPADVSVTDVLPVGALLVGGERERAMSLKDGEARKAYTYRVTIPDSWEAPVFPFHTTVYDKQAQASYDQRENLTVSLPPRPHTQNATRAQNTTTTARAPPPEKQGFFRRIIDAITSVLQSIFA